MTNVFVHSAAKWFPTRSYQALAYRDFQQHNYNRRCYISADVSQFTPDPTKTEVTLFPNPEKIQFFLIRDGPYVYLLNERGEYHLVTDDERVISSYNNYLKNLDTSILSFKNASGVDLSRIISYYPYNQDVQSADWFETTFGFPEKNWNDNNKAPIANVSLTSLFDHISADVFTGVHPVLRFNMYHNFSNVREFYTGRFGTPKLRDLRSFAKHLRTTFQMLPSGTEVRNVVIGDVFNAHSDPLYKGALFQVASQFNCLEFPTPYVTPEKGITGYVHDRTQGPACTVPTGPATFFRNYLVPVKNGVVDTTIGPSCKRGQSANNQINCLIDVLHQLQKHSDAFIRVENGYTFSTNDGLTRLNNVLQKMSPNETMNMMDNLRIGTQFGIGVTLGSDRRPIPPEKLQLVSQAFCSAISIAYDGNDPMLWEPFARLVLRASYEATMWTGVINMFNGGSNKVVLTLVGGGVFGNRLEWIADAICNAVSKVREYGLDVEIGHFSESNRRDFAPYFEKSRKNYSI